MCRVILHGGLRTAFIATVAALLLGTDAQASVPGVIAQLGCVADAASAQAEGCSAATGLRNTAYLALSPDGRNLYATARDSNSVVSFRRDAVSGKLTQLKGGAGCFDNQGGTHNPSCTGIPGLVTASGITVTPDGRSVFVAAPDSAAITTFRRNLGSGALTRVGCISGSQSLPPGCTLDSHLDTPLSLSVSANALTLYVGSRDGPTLLAFRVDRRGMLTELSCLQDEPNGQPPAPGCTPQTAIGTAHGLALSPDGRELYVAAQYGNAITALRLDPSSGAITGEIDCVSGDFDTAVTNGCAAGNAILDPQYVTATTDGRAVYAGAANSSALIVLLRDPLSGAISQSQSVDGCFSDITVGNPSCHLGLGLAYAFGIASSPDGHSVFTAAYENGSVAGFERDPSSSLLQQTGPCISDSDPNCKRGQGLNHAGFLAVSPDSRHLYVNAPSSNAIAIFAIGRDVRLAMIATTRATVHKGRTEIAIACPTASSGGCIGTVAATVDLGWTLGHFSQPVQFDLKPGQRRAYKLRLRRSDLGLIKNESRFQLAIAVDTYDQAGSNDSYQRSIAARKG